MKPEQERVLSRMIARLSEQYHLDFAGNLHRLYETDTLHKTVEYMRKHPPMLTAYPSGE